MKMHTQAITTTITFFKMEPSTQQLVVVEEDDPEAAIVNIVKSDKKGKILSSIWGEVETPESS